MDGSLLNEIKTLSQKLRDSESKNKDIISRITELCESFSPIDEGVHINGQDFKVLLVDDDAVFSKTFEAITKKIENRNIILDVEQGYDATLDKICSGDYDAVILDYYLDDFTGIEILNATQKRGCRTPIIMLTGEGNINIDIRAMEAGAYDFLHKLDLDPIKIERALRYTIKNHQSYNLVKEAKEKYMDLFSEVLSLIKK